MPFQFPKTIQVQGSVWYLVYDPNSPNTIEPSLQDAKVQNVFGSWVRVPNGQGGVGQVFMSVVDLIIPQVNMPTYKKPAQILRGFCLSPQEVDPYTQPPKSMAMYTKEAEPPVNVAQEFLNAVLIQSSEIQAQEQPKGDWTNMLDPAQPTQAPRVPIIEGHDETGTSDN